VRSHQPPGAGRATNPTAHRSALAWPGSAQVRVVDVTCGDASHVLPPVPASGSMPARRARTACSICWPGRSGTPRRSATTCGLRAQPSRRPEAVLVVDVAGHRGVRVGTVWMMVEVASRADVECQPPNAAAREGGASRGTPKSARSLRSRRSPDPAPARSG
jgi:hypothetical protein